MVAVEVVVAGEMLATVAVKMLVTVTMAMTVMVNVLVGLTFYIYTPAWLRRGPARQRGRHRT